MERDKIKTLYMYVNTILDYYNHIDYFESLELDIIDIKSPLTLIGYTNNRKFIILRGYKEKSLIKRYLSLKDVKWTFFIINPKTLVMHKFIMRWDDVSCNYYI